MYSIIRPGLILKFFKLSKISQIFENKTRSYYRIKPVSIRSLLKGLIYKNNWKPKTADKSMYYILFCNYLVQNMAGWQKKMSNMRYGNETALEQFQKLMFHQHTLNRMLYHWNI